MEKKLVMVVDDHPSLCVAVGRLLTAAGFAVKTFASGDDLLRHGVDGAGCLVLDLVLPGMNGLEVQQHLRMRPPCPPVIFYTGCEDPDGRMRALALGAGALAFLRKPFDGEELLDAVAKACAIPGWKRKREG